MINHMPRTLERDRFRLRPIERADFHPIIRQLNDPQIAPWLATVTQPFDTSDAETLFSHAQSDQVWMRVLEHDDQVAGCICFGATVWYWLDPKHWGTGLMARALTACFENYFFEPAPPLVATVRQDNSRSRALLLKFGFSQLAGPKKMFFQTDMQAHTCHDYVMTSEQWHYVHPISLTIGPVSLRPALQKDANLLCNILPYGHPWPTPEVMPEFIERYRFRGESFGLFVICDENNREIGAALLDQETENRITIALPEGTEDLHLDIKDALQSRFPRRFY